jgi:phospholipid/cholesterol/gamma-HCH transport system substrate-binding protein
MTRRGHRGMSPTVVAAITTVLIAAVCYVAFGGRLPWESDYLIRAVVRSANELQSRSPVRIAGVNVGHVTGIKRGPGSTAVVTMAIDRSSLPIHRDATIKVRPRLFLEGNFFVELQPGTPSAPNLPEGGTIPLAQTANPVQLDEILTALQTGTRANLVDLVHALAVSLEGGGAQTLHRLVPQMDPALIRSAIVAQASRGQHAGDLAGFIADGERTSRAIASRDTDLASLITALDRTLTTFGDRSAAVAGTVSGLSAVVANSRPTFAALNDLFPTARTFLAEARPGVRAAPATLRLANPLLAQLNGLLQPSELPALLVQLQPAVRSLAALEPGLGTLLGRVRPVTECLRLNALPTLRKSVVDPPLTTGQPVYREFLDSIVGLASASQNFTGDGPAVRYLAGFGPQEVTLGQGSDVGQPLVGLASSPILGSRPRYTGVRPPFRPDVNCLGQPLPNLAADTGPAPAQRRLR